MPPKGPNLAKIDAFVRPWSSAERVQARSVVEHPSLESGVSLAATNLVRRPARSTVFVGPDGVGKTSYVLALFAKLHADGWTVFEASASSLMAGQSFIGQLDQRVSDLVETMSSEKKLLWYCPGLHELIWAGRHLQSPVGAFERLLPHLESGTVRLIGECSAAAYEQLIQTVPKARGILDSVRVEPTSASDTLEIALARFGASDRTPVPESLIREAAPLADQYLVSHENPGRLLGLLDSTRRRLVAEGTKGVDMRIDDILETISVRSGLPLSLLDDREQLELATVRAHFEDRILGQPEAVSAVVDRLALVKAGLTDPSRPLGVFLFVGPTGTGKTEIAKTLAEFLFGSRERLIRLDMSEFVDAASLDRLLGERGSVADPQGLVGQIRQNPFSVVLLDEFEKADPGIWDLFLQVFDDGRLTARDGTTADFRSSILILTSNLGATDAQASGLGFDTVAGGFSGTGIQKSLESTFRPEFLNRLDRVVVFRPLSRAVMRHLLDLELKEVYERRGLRLRGWAIEWDDEAREALIDRGFSPSLGARPLKRAVERYFLVPLAEAIVEHRAPSGEQFLFVRLRDGELAVEFVDPDQPQDGGVREVGPEELPESVRLESIALAGSGRGVELAHMKSEFERLAAHTAQPEWTSRKAAGLDAMSTADFWSREDRFSILGSAEYMDRIEAGLRTAGSLLDRLDGSAHPPGDLVRRLAEQLYLVREAVLEADEGYLGEAFLEIQPSRDPREAAPSSIAMEQLTEMYQSWAEQRRMALKPIGGEGSGSSSRTFAVSGFGALRILRDETGYHVFELPADSGALKARVYVRVTAQPHTPEPESKTSALRIASESLNAAHPEQTPVVVRRYRLTSSPHVKDLVRGWKTGRTDVVLRGDFDLLA